MNPIHVYNILHVTRRWRCQPENPLSWKQATVLLGIAIIAFVIWHSVVFGQ